MTNEELDRLKALCDAATEGPWRVQADDADPVGPKDGFQPFGGCGCCGSPWVNGETKDQRNGNAAVIAASRHAIPALIAEVRTLRARAEKAEEWNRQMVAKAAEQNSLEGYRELGQKLSAADARAEALRAELDAMRGVVEALVTDWRENWKNRTPEEPGRFDCDTGYPVSGSVYVAALDALKAQQD